MKTEFCIILFVAAWLFSSLLVYAESKDRDAWGNWGYTQPQGRPWKNCPGCGSPWGPYGGRGMDPANPQPGAKNEYRMEPEQEGRGHGSGQGPEYDYGPYHPGYEHPPYDLERRRPTEDPRPGGMGSDRRP